MHMLGGFADVPLIVAVSPWAGGELFSRLFGVLNHPVIFAVAGLGGCVALVWIRRRPRDNCWAAARTGITDLLRRPRDLLVLLLASAGTTFAMGVAFALSTFTVPGAATVDQTGALITAYLIGAPLGAIVPVPAGLGSTEAALIAALGAADVATGHAIQSVLLFRVITHWAPVPIGVLSARWALRKTQSADPVTSRPTLPAL
jgi:uncharacterized membrane protein YbhN (UPF0104 family)